MREPLWKGPYIDGITQSLVGKWLVCKHRFWLYAVCGATDEKGFNLPLVYGDAFHNALEVYAFGKSSAREAAEVIKDYFHKLSKSFPRNVAEITKWSKICYDQFLAYCQVWAEEDKGFESFMAEETFRVPYTLPSGRTVITRGKHDGGILSGKGKHQSRLLAEHKIKGEIDVANLTTTLAQNFQVMFYLPPLYQKLEAEGMPPPDGVLYNVIQRPLAGRKHSIRPKKGRKVKDKKTGLYEVRGAETESQYLARLQQVYTDHPQDFFFRWKISITPEEIARFQKESLDPILEQLCDWWDSIQGDPFDPWTVSEWDSDNNLGTYPNKHHYRRPFGMYDKMAKGLVGDYQEYLTTGNKNSLQRVTSIFPELE